ncbi:MAG: sulfatase [Candidatus Latescibacteria bacterium]|jgi:arylsulfatase A-like enzyme|nr:sulfatase [Candidatus Latescibacterota bacterium]
MQRPNIVFVFADQLRYQSCGYAGDPHQVTPNLDRLAKESVNFHQAVSVFPVCTPYRASLFTGKYPSSTGVFNNGFHCMADSDAIGHVLTDAGYETAYIGKWHLWKKGSRTFIPPGPYRLGFDGHWQAYNWNHSYKNGFYYEDTPEAHTMSGYQTDAQTDLVLDYLKDAPQDKPFALFASFEVPHPPNTWDECPDEWIDKFKDLDIPEPPNRHNPNHVEGVPKMDEDWYSENWYSREEERRRVYYLMTAVMDHNVGRISDSLEELGMSENTIFVFTSDHGEMLYAHNRMQKRIFYEESIRVPFLMRWPQKFPLGMKTDVCLNTPDIMPMLLDLADVPIPESVEGVSPVSQLETSNEGNIAFMQGMSESNFFEGEEWRAVRDVQYIYVRMRTDNRELLFDHQNDPYELVDLSKDPEQESRLAHYRQILDARMHNLNDRFESTSWYTENWTVDDRIVRSETRDLEQE